MVPHGNINLEVGCENCRFADARGMNCEHGLMFPILVFLNGMSECPNFKKKTMEQLEEKWRYNHDNKSD